MNVPEGGVLEDHVGDDNVSGIHKFNEIRSGMLQSSLSPHVPPNISLAIDCAIFTCEGINTRVRKK